MFLRRLQKWWTWVTGSNRIIKRLKEIESISHSVMSTLCYLIDWSPPRFSVHGILQARILEWVSISFSRGPYLPRDRTQIFCMIGRFLTIWVTSKAHIKRLVDSNSGTYRKFTDPKVVKSWFCFSLFMARCRIGLNILLYLKLPKK